jgi:hypothetical protein
VGDWLGDDEDDDALGALVPTAFSRVVKRPSRDELPVYSLEALKGERVLVRANGFSYGGVLIGADEGELYLRTELRYLVLPLSSVTSVVPAPADRGPLGFSAELSALAGADEDER